MSAAPNAPASSCPSSRPLLAGFRSVSPLEARAFLRDVADAARAADRCRYGDWNGIVRFVERYLEDEMPATLFAARRAAIACRLYESASLRRKGACWRAIALVLFAAARGPRLAPPLPADDPYADRLPAETLVPDPYPCEDDEDYRGGARAEELDGAS